MYLLGNALITILLNLVTVHTCPGGGGRLCWKISLAFTLLALITRLV